MNLLKTKEIRVCSECRNSHEIKVATAHELYCKHFFQVGKKNLKRRNLWELLRFQ